MIRSSFLFISAFLVLACSQEHKTENKYRIVYNVYAPDLLKKDNYEVFIMNMDGEERRNLTNHQDVAWAYTSLKDKILFISDRDTTARVIRLYLMNNDGSNIEKITNYRLEDSWMSHRNNGTEIIITPHRTVDTVFYIINSKGKLLARVNHGMVNASDPAFSPDGTKIAFRAGNKISKRQEGYEEALYIMNDDGSGLEQLTFYPKADTTAPWFAYKAGPPRWHPSGDYITFQSFREGSYSLYAVDPETKKEWKLTNLEMEEGWHDWSPDGEWLAIEVFDHGQTQFHIGLMNLKTNGFKILTDSTYQYQQAPSFVLANR